MVKDIEVVDAIRKLIVDIGDNSELDHTYIVEDLERVAKKLDVVRIVMPRDGYDIIDNYLQVSNLPGYVQSAWDSASVFRGSGK